MTLEQQLKLINNGYSSGKFKTDATQLGGIMTFDKVGGNFKIKNLKIHQKDEILMQAEKTRMDNPKITKTTIN